MTTVELLARIMKHDMSDIGVQRGYFDAVRLLMNEDRKLAHEYNHGLRREITHVPAERRSSEMLQLYRDSLQLDATDEFEAAILFAEYDREPSRRFYMPRRKQLRPVVEAMQRLEERKIRLLGVMAPPGVGKSTLGIMFMVWTGLRHPELSILGSSHSNSFLRGAYDEIERMLDDAGEYNWRKIFPDVCAMDTNAKDLRIDLGERNRFETFEFSSVGSGNAGKVRASNLLYADDLVDGIEAAMSRDRMDKLWQLYTTDLRQRMIGDCVELLIQTPWTPYDPIDLLETSHMDDPEAEFIHLPALDENDNSNFDYPRGLGFSTAFYHELREQMDPFSWKALYMTEALDREGLLYNEDELLWYDALPENAPEAIVAVCDTKDVGNDYAVLPVAYKYGELWYIHEILCDNGAIELTDARMISMLVEHNVQMARFESNSAGGRTADVIQKGVTEKGGICRIEKQYTTANKETKIIVNSPYVKQHFVFNRLAFRESREYQRAMRMLFSYTMEGKNKHDDVPDAMAMLAIYVQTFGANKVRVWKRPF